jgi:murein DD-endopeptidase MepM/ murein hydrolase activator NlpD
LANPVDSPRVTQPWGRPNPRYKAKRHTGIDFGMPVGTQLYAIVDGTVANVMTDKSYGNVLVIAYVVNGVKYEDWYCHLSRVTVVKGQAVKAGEKVALSGNTGNSTGPHLHLETRIAPFKYGNDVAHPVLDLAGIVDPMAPAERKVTVLQKVTAPLTPSVPKANKVVNFAELLRGDVDDVKLVQAALVDIVGATFTPNGKFGPQTTEAYKKWQRSLGYKGTSADGKPGKTSLIALGKKYGFTVI